MNAIGGQRSRDPLFSVEVEDYDGSVLHPKPRQDKELASFIRAYEIAMTKSGQFG